MNSFATRDDTLAALRALPGAAGRRPAARLRAGQGAQAARGRPRAGRVAGRPGARVGAARPRRRLHLARHLGDARASCWSAATATCSCRTRTTSARCSTRASWPGSRPRGCRSCRSRPTAPSPTARAATWRGGAARRRAGAARDRADRRTRTARRSRTSSATASSTATTSGSTCGRCERTLAERDGVLGLPMIVNRKTVDPTDPSSPAVLQLETAMGAAIGVFEGAAALRVPRARFAPVKTTNQLLVVRSDAYELADDWTVRAGRRPDPGGRSSTPTTTSCSATSRALPRGPAVAGASARRLTVDGDVSFGRDVDGQAARCALEGPRRSPDGARARGLGLAAARSGLRRAPPAARGAAARSRSGLSMRMNSATSTSASVSDCSTIMITPATFWSSTGLRPQMRGVLLVVRVERGRAPGQVEPERGQAGLGGRRCRRPAAARSAGAASAPAGSAATRAPPRRRRRRRARAGARAGARRAAS